MLINYSFNIDNRMIAEWRNYHKYASTHSLENSN